MKGRGKNNFKEWRRIKCYLTVGITQLSEIRKNKYSFKFLNNAYVNVLFLIGL